MRARHAAEAVPSRPGLAVVVLGALGLAPPALFLAPQLLHEHAVDRPSVSRPDVEPDLDAGAELDRPPVQPDRSGLRDHLVAQRPLGEP